MNHRRPTRRTEVRPNRQLESWMVNAVIALIALSTAVLTVTEIVVPAFAAAGARLEAATTLPR